MAKLSPASEAKQTQRLASRKARAKSTIGNRNLLYDLRRSYYDGNIKPTVERGHDQIFTQYAATIVDKLAAYAAGNGLTIKIKPKDISNPEEAIGAEAANQTADDLYNRNKDFQYQIYLLHQTSGWAGDGYLTTEMKDGVPYHRSISQPQNVFVGFRDNQFEDIDFWIFEMGMDPAAIKDMYDIEVGSYSIPQLQAMAQGIGTHQNPYGADNRDRLKEAQSSFLSVNGTQGMALYTVMHDLIEGDRIQAFNDVARFKDSNITDIYHFPANVDPGRPWGLSDFETIAHLITKMEEKMSEQSDAASESVHHKILTDLNPQEIKENWKPNKTQAIKVKGGANGDRLEILKTNVNTFDIDKFIGTLLNVIRTGSGLQELGQDQISANVSGRAIQYMFQGVNQKILVKHQRLERILTSMVISDFELLAKSDPSFKKVCFNENGDFRFNVTVKYPPVMEQEEQIRIANTTTMINAGIISKYTGRTILNDYVDDPIEEQKRIDQEQDAEMQKEAKKAQMAAAAQPPPQQPAAPVSIAVPGMEPVNAAEGSGVVSTPGNAGSAQAQMSAAGFQNQLNQQASA